MAVSFKFTSISENKPILSSKVVAADILVKHNMVKHNLIYHIFVFIPIKISAHVMELI